MLIRECKKKYKDFEETNCFRHLDDDCLEALQMIFDTNQKIKDMGLPIKNYLVIMDDVISESAIIKRNGILTQIAT